MIHKQLKIVLLAIVAVSMTTAIPQTFAGFSPPDCEDFEGTAFASDIFKVNPSGTDDNWVVYGNVVQFGRYDVTGNGPTDDDGWIVEGTKGNDVITGSSRGDLIKAGKGNDIVCSDQGADVIQGGFGNDQMRGGNGNDTLLGGWGEDRMHGGNDNDTMEGGQNDDIMLGGGNSDDLDGGPDYDTANGQVGTDTCEAEIELNCEA